ncbi:MAG: hypothetical protein DWQ01_12850 [Planctomycetota bacterium]|nr:MAG: hypothetical protein DWQ01_12850 [Planctomycetota bacterium]
MPSFAPISDDSNSVAFDLLAQMLQDQEKGEILDLQHYLRRFPGHDLVVATEYLRFMNAYPEGGSAEEEPSSEKEEGAQDAAEDQIGPYSLRRTLGRGGQGVVYLAHDSRIDRFVALKVLDLAVGTLTPNRLARFRREAEAVGRLNHPGICSLYEAQIEAEPPYLVMQYLEGLPLNYWIAAASRAEHKKAAILPIPPRDFAEIKRLLEFFQEAARALHEAHCAGVFHRDVKPGNVMVNPQGSPVWMDFGLARMEHAGLSTLTRSGELFGTPAYMAPEQLQEGGAVDARTDLYGLAAVFYECLTLQRPLEADSVEGLFQAIQRMEPKPADSLNPAVPRDLAVVLEVALDKEPRRRYSTLLDFTEDLKRIWEKRPIQAKPAGVALRFKKVVLRHPVMATATTGIFLLLLGALILSLFFLDKVQVSLNHQNALLLANQAERLVETEPAMALKLAVQAAQDSGGQDPAAFQQALLKAMDGFKMRWQREVYSSLVSIAYDPKNHRFAAMASGGWIYLIHGETGELLKSASIFERGLGARMNQNGTCLATWAVSGELQFWRLPDLHPILPQVWRGSRVFRGQFSPDGWSFASCHEDGRIRIFSAKDGRLLKQWQGHQGATLGANWSSDGNYLLSFSGRGWDGPKVATDNTARLWETKNWNEVKRFVGHQAPLWFADFCPEGNRVITTSEDGSIRLWDRLTAETLWQQQAPGRVYQASFDLAGRRVAVASHGLRVRGRPQVLILEMETGNIIRRLTNPSWMPFVATQWSPDRQWLGASSFDGNLYIWDGDSGILQHKLPHDARFDHYNSWLWLPGKGSSSPLILSANGNDAMLWDLELKGVHELVHSEEPLTKVRFHPDGHRLLTAGRDGWIRIWNWSKQRLDQEFFSGHYAVSQALFLNSDGGKEWLLAGKENGELLRLSGKLEQKTVLLPEPGSWILGCLASRDGSKVLTWSEDGTARVWDWELGQEVTVFRGHQERILAAAWFRDGRHIVTASQDGTAQVWNAETGQPLTILGPFESDFQRFKGRPPSIRGLLLNGQEDRILLACEDVRIRSFDLGSGTPELDKVFDGAPRTPGELHWLKEDETFLLVDAWGNGARIFRYDQEQVQYHHRCPATIRATVVDPRRNVVAIGCVDGSVQIWDWRKREIMLQYQAHQEPVVSLAFSPEGNFLATASLDGIARVFPVNPLQLAEQRAKGIHFLKTDRRFQKLLD